MPRFGKQHQGEYSPMIGIWILCEDPPRGSKSLKFVLFIHYLKKYCTMQVKRGSHSYYTATFNQKNWMKQFPQPLRYLMLGDDFTISSKPSRLYNYKDVERTTIITPPVIYNAQYYKNFQKNQENLENPLLLYYYSSSRLRPRIRCRLLSKTALKDSRSARILSWNTLWPFNSPVIRVDTGSSGTGLDICMCYQ